MIWMQIGSLLMCLGVALGAFGAHGLKELLSQEAKQTYQTAVFYHLVHGLGLIAVGWLAVLKPGSGFIRAAGWSFLMGIVFFSGSLYLLSLTGIRQLGLITPLGGLALLAGWLCLAWAATPRHE